MISLRQVQDGVTGWMEEHLHSCLVVVRDKFRRADDRDRSSVDAARPSTDLDSARVQIPKEHFDQANPLHDVPPAVGST